jgi:hypothetical protein
MAIDDGRYDHESCKGDHTHWLEGEMNKDKVEEEEGEGVGQVPSSTYFLVVTVALVGIAFFFDAVLGLTWFNL